MLDNVSKEFNLREDIIYLNHAGVSPWPLRTSRAVRKFAEENLAQGSLRFLEWIKVETDLRMKAQLLLNAPSKDNIALLKNTSEALSVVAYGLNFRKGDNVVSSDQEFPSNRIVWQSLSRKGVEFREADLRSDDSPEDALFSLVDDRTRLITVSSVQFSTGLRMDLRRIGKFCRERGILFCVDAIQSAGALRFDVQEISADFVMADGHKWMLGPEGTAVFYCGPDAIELLDLNQYGWHMVEDAGDFDRRDWRIAITAKRFECGSPNMLGIHALNASLSLLLDTGMDRVEREILQRSVYLIDIIKSQDNLELITPSEAGRYAGITTFRRTDVNNADLYRYLTGSNVVCAPRSGGIRFSPHFYTPYAKIDEAMELIVRYAE